MKESTGACKLQSEPTGTDLEVPKWASSGLGWLLGRSADAASGWTGDASTLTGFVVDPTRDHRAPQFHPLGRRGAAEPEGHILIGRASDWNIDV